MRGRLSHGTISRAVSGKGALSIGGFFNVVVGFVCVIGLVV